MRPRNIEEPFKLRDCVEEIKEFKIITKAPGATSKKEMAAHKKKFPEKYPGSIEAQLSEKVNEIEALLRSYFEQKFDLKPGELAGPFSNVSQLKKGIGKNVPRAFKWTFSRDFDVRLFEVYFITGKHLSEMFDVAQHSAVSAYPPPPKPLVVGYTLS